MSVGNDVAEVALITGGTRGIGLGIAQHLVRKGCHLAITGRRDSAEVQATVDVLLACATDTRQRVVYLRADVSSAADRAALIRGVKEEFGRLDVLVNNAGIAPRVRADILEATEESFDEVLGTNLKGPYFLTQAVAGWMVEQQAQQRERRSIINVSSVSATVASTNRGDYCISKAGIAMATMLWATRLTDFGINVYEVRPGVISTDMTAGVKGKYDALMESNLLLERRWGTPDDIGRAVAMLAAGDLPYAPGAVLVLDGGMTLLRL